MATAIPVTIKFASGQEKQRVITLHGRLYPDGTFHHNSLGRGAQEFCIEKAWDLLDMEMPIIFPIEPNEVLQFPGMNIRTNGDNGLLIDLISELDGKKTGSQEIHLQRIEKPDHVELNPASLPISLSSTDAYGNPKKIDFIFVASDYPI